MSLLWKKPKSCRLSRLMSEFQQSPKRGGIMVVETGFPTSLIDLFFKNRDRLKKSSSKTKRIQRLIQTAPNASLPFKPDASLKTRKTVGSKIDKVNFVVGGGLTAENKKHKSDGNGRVCVCSGGSGALVLLAFKIFIVAVLALSTTKNLTMGFTLSTLALLLTENVKDCVLTRFKLCSTDTEKEKPLASIHDENLISCEKNKAFDDPKSISCLEVTENSKDLKIRDLLSKDEKSRSKSSKLRSKIVKKLRSFRKTTKTIVIEEETLTDVSSVVSEDKSEVIESERDEEKSSPTLMESKGHNMDGVVVIVIVLTGLLSGKILAIGLTLSCLFLRFGAAKKSGLCI